MARTAKSRGRGKKPWGIEQLNELSSSGANRDRNPITNLINESSVAYQLGRSEEIRRLIEEWEVDMKRQESAIEIEMEHWKILVLDTGHTHGRVTQFKHTLYVYWLMKCLMGKAME